MSTPRLHLPSLAQHFEAPEGYRSEFGWMCGYSADAAFLDSALERYTRQSTAQRAWDGRVWLALMLDPGNPAISWSDAPGIAHLAFRVDVKRPFVLMHAKVALLGFAGEDDPNRWLLRLIVSTGNWTQQTLEESLDLAWRIDLSADDLKISTAAARLASADFGAAIGLLEWLGQSYDRRLIEGQARGRMEVAAHARKRVEAWMVQCRQVAGTMTPRFFDNRRASLLKQIPDLINKHTGSVRRNYLGMGSGYFEGSDSPPTAPRVPLAIRDLLRREQLLTQSAEMDIFVNPEGCQAVAVGLTALNAADFVVRKAIAPGAVYGDSSVRTLHAKFIFGANYREGSERCRSPWLYLGSGNLTSPGFLLASGESRGNLEAGVVFAPPDVPWEYDPSHQGQHAVNSLLPIQWETELTAKDAPKCGKDFPERPDAFLSAPVAWLRWAPGDERGQLIDDAIGESHPDANYSVLDAAGIACPESAESAGRFEWVGVRPREVAIEWWATESEQRRAVVPVIDECGRIGATAIPKLDLNEARWQLLEFPSAPPLDEEDPGPTVVGSELAAPMCAQRGAATGSYAIRDMMVLIEAIAERQTRVAAHDWVAWCARLEQTLIQTADDPSVTTFVQLGINPLQPLREPPFRPTFAERDDGAAGERYAFVLNAVEQAWGVNGLAGFGGQP